MDNGASSYRRFLDGDESAFNEIMEELFRSLVFFINGYVHDIHAAEDIAIDAFSDLVVHRHRYNFKVTLKTYVFMLGRSRALDYIKHRKVLSFVELSEAEGVEDEKTLEEIVLADERKRTVHSAIAKLSEVVDSVVKELLIFMMICVVLCVLLQVAGRYLPFIKPLPWTEEIARWLLVWLTFLGASHIAKSSSYTRIDIFTSKMSPKVQKVISVISKLCMLGFVGVFAAKSLIVFTTVSVHEKGPSSQLPMLLMRSAVFVGMIITFLQMLSAGGIFLTDPEEESETL